MIRPDASCVCTVVRRYAGSIFVNLPGQDLILPPALQTGFPAGSLFFCDSPAIPGLRPGGCSLRTGNRAPAGCQPVVHSLIMCLRTVCRMPPFLM